MCRWIAWHQTKQQQTLRENALIDEKQANCHWPVFHGPPSQAAVDKWVEQLQAFEGVSVLPQQDDSFRCELRLGAYMKDVENTNQLVAVGKAKSLQRAVLLCAMHAELCLDFASIPLFPWCSDTQALHERRLTQLRVITRSQCRYL